MRKHMLAAVTAGLAAAMLGFAAPAMSAPTGPAPQQCDTTVNSGTVHVDVNWC